MSKHYLICRSWLYFEPSFPFYQQLNHQQDDEILPELDKLCLAHFHDQKEWFKKELRRRMTKMRAAIEKQQRSTSGWGHSKNVRRFRDKNGRVRPILESIRGPRCTSLACRVAQLAGWSNLFKQKDFGNLSPSRMLVVLKEKCTTVKAVEAQLTEYFDANNDWFINLMFFSLPVADFDLSQQSVLEARLVNNIQLNKDRESKRTLDEASLHCLVAEQSTKALEIAKKLAGGAEQGNAPVDIVARARETIAVIRGLPDAMKRIASTDPWPTAGEVRKQIYPAKIWADFWDVALYVGRHRTPAHQDQLLKLIGKITSGVKAFIDMVEHCAQTKNRERMRIYMEEKASFLVECMMVAKEIDLWADDIESLGDKSNPKSGAEVTPVESNIENIATTEQWKSGNEAVKDGSTNLSELIAPIPVVEVVRAVGHKAGRSDKLAEKMKRHNYLLVKSGRKWYCQRKDAIVMFPHHKQRIEEI